MNPLLASWINRRPNFLGSAAAVQLASATYAAPRRESLGPASVAVLPVMRATDIRGAGVGLRRVRMRVDPSDHQRTLISGRMCDVCDALDDLISGQTA